MVIGGENNSLEAAFPEWFPIWYGQFLGNRAASRGSLMVFRTLIFWAVVMAIFPREPTLAQAYDGPLIDAHSQVDCAVDENLVVGKIKALNIGRVLISIRGCKGSTADSLEDRWLASARRHPNRISVLLASKVDGGSFAGKGPAAAASLIRRAKVSGFAGLAEVLVHHAPHEHSLLSYPGL